jgi:hypothetical protein
MRSSFLHFVEKPGKKTKKTHAQHFSAHESRLFHLKPDALACAHASCRAFAP